MCVGVVIGGQLRQAGQQRRLAQRQLARFLAKIGLGRGINAVGKITVVDLVQIKLEDVVLAVAPRDFGRQNRFLNLARRRALRGEQHALDQLLRDRRSAGDDVAFLERIVDGAHQRHRVDAGMLVEVGVLGGDGCLDDVGRHGVQRHLDAPPRVGVERLVEQVALAVVDARRLEGAGALAQFAGRRQIARHGRVANEQHARAQHRQHDEEQRSADKPAPEAVAPGGYVAGRPAASRLGRLQFVHRQSRSIVAVCGPGMRPRHE